MQWALTTSLKPICFYSFAVMEKDEFFMAEALKQAKLALDNNEVPIGAIFVIDDKIIVKSYNQTEKLNDVTAHAEILALTAASYNMGNKYLRDGTIYVTIEPCPMCAAALNWAQVGRIVFGASDPKRGYSLFQPSLIHPKTEVTQGIKEDVCAHLLTDFFKGRRKNNII